MSLKFEWLRKIGVPIAVLTLSGSAFGQDPIPATESLERAYPEQRNFSPYAGRNFPTQVFWAVPRRPFSSPIVLLSALRLLPSCFSPVGNY